MKTKISIGCRKLGRLIFIFHDCVKDDASDKNDADKDDVSVKDDLSVKYDAVEDGASDKDDG